MNASKVEAKLLKSAVLRTNLFNRPQPTIMYFPGIKSQSIWNGSDFPSVKLLENNYSTIKEEFNTAIKNHQLNNDYLTNNTEHSLHKGSWNWYSYIQKGKKMDLFEKNFPNTYQILNSMDDLLFDIPFAYTFFSQLENNSEIDYHYGPCNFRLRIHLALQIPNSDQCYMNIEEHRYKWEEGKCLLFDDSYIHSVTNKSGETRVILLVDIWHPEITKKERLAIQELFLSTEKLINRV